MICVSCCVLLIHWLMHIVLPFFYFLLLTTDCNNHKNGSWCFLHLVFPLSAFPPDPAPFIIWMQQKWKKNSSRSHFINCCCVPKHISSLKHLDISVIEHFSPLLMKYTSQCTCVCLHVHERDKNHVCVAAPVPLCNTLWHMSVMYNLVNWSSMCTGLSMGQ